MKSSPTDIPPAAGSSNRRGLLLAPVFVVLGIVLAGLWFQYGKHAPGSLLPEAGGSGLDDSTRDLLRQLNSPVEIRFYAVLPPDSAPASLQDFSGRVDRLLSVFQNVNDRQIRVVRNLATADANADAAAADGIQAFNLEKGNACFLGITVVSGGRKESLARLRPEWEPALPFDLARAILRVTAAASPSVVRPSPPVSPEITDTIRRLIPDISNTSLEDGSRILRTAAVQELVAAGAEAEKQIELAKQQLADAQSGGSEAQQQTARQHLQQVQSEQADKIKAIAARLQTELDVFQQMKTAAAPAK